MNDIVDISGKPIEMPKGTNETVDADADTEQVLRDAFSFFFGNLIEEDEADEYIKAFSSLMSLDDEKFMVIASGVLEKFYSSFKDPQIQLGIAQNLAIQGVAAEDMIDELASIAENLQKSLDGKISQIKIDFFKSILGIVANALGENERIARRVISVPIQRLFDEVKLPEYAHTTDSGLDVFALDDYTIDPGEIKIIPTGLRVALPKGYEIQVRAKSGLSARTHMRVANGIGTVDEGFHDEIGIILENNEPAIKDITYDFDDETHRPIITSILHGSPVYITKGQKIAQLVLAEIPKISWQEVNDITLYGAEDRQGGFGSTGKF